MAEREPKTGTIVLGEWKSGAVRVVEWTSKRFEGQPERANDPLKRAYCIYLAHMDSMGVVGFREWPIRWAELFPGGTP